MIVRSEESRQGRGMPDEVSSRVIGTEICCGLLESGSRSLPAGSFEPSRPRTPYRTKFVLVLCSMWMGQTNGPDHIAVRVYCHEGIKYLQNSPWLIIVVDEYGTQRHSPVDVHHTKSESCKWGDGSENPISCTVRIRQTFVNLNLTFWLSVQQFGAGRRV